MKHKYIVTAALLVLVASNPSWALNVKMDGADVAVADNDIFALLKQIGAYLISLIFGAISMFALVSTMNTLWHKWGDVHHGKMELKDLFGPATVGFILVVVTFSIASYTITNFTNFFS